MPSAKYSLDRGKLFTGIVRDISERNKAEEQLRFYAGELQGRNAELLRSNQELDEFAYIASHDLKEPLRGIHNYATFLLEDYESKLDAEGVDKLETLKRLTQRMDVLLDSLLDFSRVGRLDFAIRTTDLNEVLEEVLDSLRINLKERGVEIRIPRPLPIIQGDRVRIGEVLRNLITNAMKYNDKPEKWIEIGHGIDLGLDASKSNEIEPITGRHTVFYVRDNGIGIPEKHFDAIFRIFKRLHARDEFGGGTGVGLTIVKKIIERHGGQIWIESARGARDVFLLHPLSVRVTMLNQHPILLVEDSPEDREATIRALKRAGVANPIYCCASGDEALDYLLQRDKYADPAPAPRPNLILLDLNMPGTDGREVLAEIKKSDTLRSIPVIILTTSTDIRDVTSCYQMGANSYVKKPVDLEGFMLSIQRLKDYWFEVVVLPKAE